MTKTSHTSVRDKFFQRENNKNARKKIAITYTDDSGEVVREVLVISKVTLEKAAAYADMKMDDGNLVYFAEMFNNHVFDAETGDNYFRIEEILEKTPCTSLAQFLNELVPAEFILAVQTAINDFTGVSNRKTTIEEIKN